MSCFLSPEDGSPVSEGGTMHTFVGTSAPCPPAAEVCGNWGACRKLLAFKGVQVHVPPAPSPTAQGAGPGTHS